MNRIILYIFGGDNVSIDMHIHSYYSDGAYLPEEVISLAAKNGVSTLAITDHDTLLGIQYLYKNSKFVLPDMEIIPGIEITGKVFKGSMHILGYGLDIYNEDLINAMKKQREKRIASLIAICDYLKKNNNIYFSSEEINEIIFSERSIGRPDLAKLLIKHENVETVSEAFSKYLRKAYEMTREEVEKGLPYQECFELIKNAGGIPVLAHPKTLELDEIEFLKLLKEMISCGLMGMEVYHSIHTPTDIQYYLNIASDYGLLVSGGSDFHGETVKPNIQLGVTGRNKNIVLDNLSLVDELHNGLYKILKKNNSYFN